MSKKTFHFYNTIFLQQSKKEFNPIIILLPVLYGVQVVAMEAASLSHLKLSQFCHVFISNYCVMGLEK